MPALRSPAAMSINAMHRAASSSAAPAVSLMASVRRRQVPIAATKLAGQRNAQM